MSEMSDKMKPPPVTPFSLKMDSDFGSRANDIFGSLGNIELKHEAYQKVRSKSHEGRRDDRLLKDDPREESPLAGGSASSSRSRRCDNLNQGFKKPQRPAPRKGGPRHHTTGHHRPDTGSWTYYNLADVPADDMSDRSNTAAALSFLQGCKSTDNPNKRLKTSPDDADESMDTATGTDSNRSLGPGRHVFKKSTHSSPQADEQNKPLAQVIGRPGCVVMPEYVVGKKDTINKAKPKKLGSKGKLNFNQVSMGHLFDDDDDDDDDNDDAEEEDGEEKCYTDIRREKKTRSSDVQIDSSVQKTVRTPALFGDCTQMTAGQQMMDTDQPKPVTFTAKNMMRKQALRSSHSTEDINTNDDGSNPKDIDLDGVD